MKKLLKAGLVITVVGIVFLVIAIIGGGVQPVAYTGWTPQVIKKELVTKKQTVKEFSNIHVTTDNVGIRIVKGNGYHLSYKGRKSLMPKVKVSGETLTVVDKSGHPNVVFDGFEITSNRHTKFSNVLTITVPKDLTDVSIKTFGNSDVDVVISDLKLNSLRANVVDGDMHLTNTQVENDSKIEIIDGDFYFDRVALNNGGHVRVADGDVQLVDTSLKNITFENSDGDLNINRVKVDGGNYTSQDGDISGTDFEVVNGYQLSSNDGDISLSGVKADGYESSTTDGDNVLFEQRNGHTLSQGATTGNVLRVKSVDGDISIH